MGVVAVPSYRVWRDGVVVDERADICELWDEGMVGFLLGCSFSWEGVLQEAGLTPRQIEEGCNVPMYATTRRNKPVGPFGGRLVVSMRPYRPEQVDDVIRITQVYPGAHGGPVHWGAPEDLLTYLLTYLGLPGGSWGPCTLGGTRRARHRLRRTSHARLG